MAMLTKADILSADDRSTKTLNVPEWGGEIILRSLSSKDRDRYEEILMSDTSDKYDNVVANFVSKSIVDDKGRRVFSDAEIAELGNKSGNVMLKIFFEARDLNNLSEEHVEELAKN